MDVDKRAIRRSLRTDFSPSLKLRAIRAAAAARRAINYPALLMGGRLQEPIFIIGAPRSGTSLLYAILRASSRTAHWPGEAHEVWEYDYHPALRGWESNALDETDIEEGAADRIKRSFFLVAGSHKRLIDKTPRNALRVPFVNALFDDARFVFLQRDGRDNVNSLITAWQTPRYRTYRPPHPHSIPGVDPSWWKFVLYPGWREDTTGPLELVCAKQWTYSNELALDGLEEVPYRRRITIRYEDLVDRPVEEVGRVMDLLGLPYEDSVRAKARETHTKPINIVTPPERGKWRRENPGEVASILDLIAPTMERLGYPL
jgi:LPS sulfotransferase NodH